MDYNGKYVAAIRENRVDDAAVALDMFEKTITRQCAREVVYEMLGMSDFLGPNSMENYYRGIMVIWKDKQPILYESCQKAIRDAYNIKRRIAHPDNAAIPIQRAWRHVICNPRYAVCKNRLLRELNELKV